MAVGDDVAARIEQKIKEAIDRLVADLRSSLEDVRKAVDQQMGAAVQSVQADAKAFSVRGEIAPILDELVAAAEAAQATPFPEAPPAAPAIDTSAILRRSVRAIERGKSQVEILNALLDEALNYGSRVALLILKGENFSGWKGAGFTAHGGNDEIIKRFSAPSGKVAELDRLRTVERTVVWDGGSFARAAGVSDPVSGLVVPMVIKDKVAAAVYIDSVNETRKLDQAAIELLVFTTGLLIDTLAIRKRIPSPTLSPDEAPAEAGDIFEAVAEPEPEIEVSPHRTIGDATVAVTPEMIRAATGMAPPPPAPAPVPHPVPPPVAAPEPAPRPVPPPALAPPPIARPHEERPSTQYVPPPGAHRAAAPMSEEAKKHDDAKRFARLLVSEIKLYNEAKVDQGRKNHDLYERLKEDVDRSRQMYDERVPDEVRKVSNYFYDELVRILADGNQDALGL